MRIALVGNPNSGKTTLFNQLTGSNQKVGNWAGVTVDKTTGHLKSDPTIQIIDLPGIYSLSPYTPEEEIARNYLLDEKPDLIINIIDGTNLDRNLYLTSQLAELNLPLILAINMGDVLESKGFSLDINKLEDYLGLSAIKISALTGKNIQTLIDKAVEMVSQSKTYTGHHLEFSTQTEKRLSQISNLIQKEVEPGLLRWFSIKLFENDQAMFEKLNLSEEQTGFIHKLIAQVEIDRNDNTEGVIGTERYQAIEKISQKVLQRRTLSSLTLTDKIDKIVTHRIFALPIFFFIMFFVYFISVSTIGAAGTDWTNENLFGEGWFLLGKGRSAYEEVLDDYNLAQTYVEGFSEQAGAAGIMDTRKQDEQKDFVAQVKLYDVEGNVEEVVPVDFDLYTASIKVEEPDPNTFGPFIPGISELVNRGMENLNVSPWLQDLVNNGIIAGVGSVLGFVPQMFVLFLCLAFLEEVGYMSRIAYVMDHFFRRFGLPGKSFISLMIGAGCSVPGIMASRTIENERDRRMTIITTSFIPCGAKLPVIALFSGAFFGGSSWVTTLAYFIGIFAVIITGIILKKTKYFAGEVAPFIIELPNYQMPRLRDILKSAFERALAFIQGAGTVILLTTILIWFLSSYGFEETFGPVDFVENSILARVGSYVSIILAPLGFGSWQATTATVTGLIAKENIVGTFGVLYSSQDIAENGWQIWQAMRMDYSQIAAFSFLLFNLLCAPCFAAIGAIRAEMKSGKWTAFAIAYQTIFAYTISFIFYQIASFISTQTNPLGFAIALVLVVIYLNLIFKPSKYEKGEKVFHA